ncbi:MAG TPA: DUF2875 family protein [Holophaga sp.]|nr:DUF2875 family protein [Holophaga sp.]
MQPRTRPRLWPYALLPLTLLVLWVLALEMFMKPEVLSPLSASPQRRLLWWCVPPLLVVLSLFAFQWGRRTCQAMREARLAQAEQQAKEAREQAEAAAIQAQKDHDRYSLEVYGLGLSIDDDHLNTNAAWDALQGHPPHAVVLRTDPKEYPWSKDEKGGPGSQAFVDAIQEFPEKWELPFLLGGPVLHDPESANYLKGGLAGARTGGGMHFHRFRTVSQAYDEQPDRLPAELFELFDQYPDLPAAALAAEDGLCLRELLDPTQRPLLLKDGYEIPKLTGTLSVLLLGRRDRVDLLRPTATEIPIRDIQIKIESEPPPQGITLDSDHVLSYDDAPPKPQLPDATHHLRPFWEAQGGGPAAFRPSRFVKRPWCQEQLVQFDLLPVLARLHRPQTADYVRDGKPLGARRREEVFLETWKKALATLPEGELPVRVIYDFGPKGAARVPPLSLAIRAVGPDLDIMGKDGIDITASMRDTGANSFYVGIALGILATQKAGGASAVVDLRRDDRATIIMVSPPTDQDRIRRKIHFHSSYMGTIDQE